MKVGIIGSGSVGRTLAKDFIRLGHQVVLGTRSPEKANAELEKERVSACAASNEEAAKFGEWLVLCTKWDGVENAIELAKKEHFSGKIVIDTTNPLKFEVEGKPPVPGIVYPDSMGKRVQDLLPQSKVVKCFNIVTAAYMLNPALKDGTPTLFICGNDAPTKQQVSEFVKGVGWEVHDLGDITQSYLLENMAILWTHYGFFNNHWNHAFKLLQK